MAICTLNRDLLRTNSCGYQLSEVKDIYLANMADISGTTAGTSSDTGCTGEELTTIGLVSGGKFYHIQPQKNSVNFTDELVVTDTGGKYRTHTLTFSISGQYDACTHLDFDALSLGSYLCVVVTAEGKWLALGRIGGMEANAATLAGGNDSNGITITLSANVAESALPLSTAAINTVKGGA